MLSKDQLLRLRYLLDDGWVCDTGSPDDDRRTWRQFHTALDPMGPEELHLFAANFSCETGVEELRRVIRHARCDLGTALLIFWQLSPGWYLQYASPDQVPQHEWDIYELLTEIQEKAVAGAFPCGVIAFDPRQLDGRDLTQEYLREGGIRHVAAEMFVTSSGRVLPLRELG
jgi:hypothetical protein